MWDPGNYLDTDYGLEEGESFEPDGSEDWDEVDLTGPHIRTVLGPIPSDALGICLPFEYLSAYESEISGTSASHLPIRDRQIAEELEMYFVSGGRSVVNIIPARTEQDMRRLHSIGRRVPVHIITAVDASSLAGDQSDQEWSRAQAEQAGVVMLDLGSEQATEHLAKTVSQSGLPLFLRGGDTDRVLNAIATLADSGMDISRATFLPDAAQLHGDVPGDLASQGAMIGFSDVGGDNDAHITASVVRLMEAGYMDRILISCGLRSPTQYVSQGGQPGWTFVLEHFSLQLMAAGVPAMGIRHILIDNPAKALSVVPLTTQAPSESV